MPWKITGAGAVNSSAILTTPASCQSGPYRDFVPIQVRESTSHFLTNLTGDAPTASYNKGLTTGRAEWGWFNHIDTNLLGFGPFVNFGLANGRMDQHFLPRPYGTICPFGYWAIWLTLREASSTRCSGDIGYNHSVRYALDGVAITVQFNANSLFRKMTNF